MAAAPQGVLHRRTYNRGVPRLGAIRDEGFRVDGPFDSRFAAYEDRRADYVTSEPALDYTAASVLLVAVVRAGCAG